jgi:carbonic anhydrase
MGWDTRPAPEEKKTMSIIDEAAEANRGYAKNYDPSLGKRPAPKIAVVTCMDPRLSDLSGILGLPQADLDVIRTGGPAVTDDVLGELVVSNRILGTTEILLLNHTGCGFTTFTDEELNAKLSAATGDASPAPMRFFSYKDPGRKYSGTNQESPIASLDLPRRARARFYFRRGNWPYPGSSAGFAHRCLKGGHPISRCQATGSFGFTKEAQYP